MIFVVAGPGGVGKGSVVARLLALEPDVCLSRSWTTRPRRPGEANDAYQFVSREAFQNRIAAEGFLEWTEFAGTGHFYGTPIIETTDGRDKVLEIELDGYRQIKRRYPDAVLILIVAPSPEVQEKRLRGRGDRDADVRRRLAVGADEERVGRQLADYVVVNDDVDRAACQVADILREHRSGP
jgi:guanylate kinase